MDQKKIGKFIAECRKNKKMTQEKLAEKMGVSINAVSKWERGLSFPDVSLYKNLCNELDINIEELINGEKNNSNVAKEKAIILAIQEKEKIKKDATKKICLLLGIFLFIVSGIIIYHMNNRINFVNDSDELYDMVIEYLVDEEFKNNEDSNKNDFNVFYSYYSFGVEKKGDYKYVYMWIYKQSYYIEDENALAISSGFSAPCKIGIKNNKIIKIDYPQEDNNYNLSINKIFPKIIASKILTFTKNENINKLYIDVINRKDKYYNYLNINTNNLTIDNISYDDLIFSINSNNDSCIPIKLDIYKDNKYILYTAYETCKPKTICTSALKYTKSMEGRYDYDIIQIIRHSLDANYTQSSNYNLVKYEIHSGNGYSFVTNSDNKNLNEFLELIGIDLSACATAEYVD